MSPRRKAMANPVANPKDNRVILFDCFGLFLADPFRLFFREKLGPDYAETKDRFCRPGDLGEISYSEFLNNIGSFFQMDPTALRSKAKKAAVPCPEMFDLAKRCKEVRPVYLLSNCMEGMIDEYFPLKDLSLCFDRLFLSNEMKRIKPFPESYQYVLNELGLSPEQVFFFDDNKRNVDAAKALGINASLFTSVADCEKDLMDKGLL